MSEFFAVIDIGSNSVKYSLGSFEKHTYAIEDYGKNSLRLLEAGSQEISEGKQNELIDILKQYIQACETKGATIEMVATSSMRRATNQKAVLARIEQACNHPVKVLTGDQEAYYAMLGVQARFGLRMGEQYLLDVGGGSVEMIALEDGEPLWMNSMAIGPTRIKEKVLDCKKDAKVKSWLYGVLEKNKVKANFDHPRVYISGGTPGSVAKMVYQFKNIPVRSTHGLSVQKKDLVELHKHLCSDPKAMDGFVNVPASRFDLIRPTLRLLISVLTFLHADTYIVCRSGLREGIIFERAGRLNV